MSSVAWWPDRRSDVIQYVQSCLECTSFGPATKHEPLHPILTHQAFDMLGLDYIGPLPETPDGNKYILNIIDYFTRFGRPMEKMGFTRSWVPTIKESAWDLMYRYFDPSCWAVSYLCVRCCEIRRGNRGWWVGWDWLRKILPFQPFQF